MKMSVSLTARVTLRPLFQLLRLGYRPTFAWVFLKGPVLLRGLALACVVLTLWAGYHFFNGVVGTDRLFVQALTARVSNESNGGLEALVLPEFKQSEQNQSSNAKLTSSVIVELQQLKKLLSAETGRAGTTTTNDLEVISSPTGTAITDKYFTEAKSRSFLFVPATAVLQTNVADEKLVDDQALKDALISNLALYHDLQISESIDDVLCKLTEMEALMAPPAMIPLVARDEIGLNRIPRQAYFITARGVMRICEAGTSRQSDYYRDQFRPTMSFPDRPYFRETLSHRYKPLESGATLADFFLTAPYVDLGGNGVVLTACRTLSSTTIADSILCLDFSFSNTMVKQVQDKLSHLGAVVVPVDCSLQKRTDSPVQCHTADALRPQFPELRHSHRDDVIFLQGSIQKAVQSVPLSDIFGRIWTVQHMLSGLRFTIPVRQTLSDTGRTGTFLFCDVDLGRIQRSNVKRAAFFTMALALLLFFLFLLVVDYGGRMIEQEKAFDAVAEVMYGVPLAYCRTDILSSRIIDFNEEFARLLGYRSLVEAREDLRFKSFADLIATEEDHDRYSHIIQERKKGYPIGDYSLVLQKVARKSPAALWKAARKPPMDDQPTPDERTPHKIAPLRERISNLRSLRATTTPYEFSGERVRVRVHAAVVPTPQDPRGSFQQAFGILVPESKSGGPRRRSSDFLKADKV
jgi:PAS domain-containing protein